MPEFLLPDTTELRNFGSVDQLSLLKEFLGQRGRVVAAVAHEIRASIHRVPAIGRIDLKEWFGAEVEIDDIDDSQRVDVLRTTVFGGTARNQMQHLGESQTLFVIMNRPEFTGSTWITDDGEAFRYAKKKGILTLHTRGVLEALVSRGELSAQSAFELCEKMQEADRDLLDPPRSSRDFT